MRGSQRGAALRPQHAAAAYSSALRIAAPRPLLPGLQQQQQRRRRCAVLAQQPQQQQQKWRRQGWLSQEQQQQRTLVVTAANTPEGGAAGGGGGSSGGSADPMRPKARAASPVQLPAVDPTGGAAAAGVGGSGSGGSAAGAPPVQSYSSFYRAHNTRYGVAPPSGGSGSGSSSNGGGGARPAAANEAAAAAATATAAAHEAVAEAAASAAEAAAAAAADGEAAATPEQRIDGALKAAQDALAAAETELTAPPPPLARQVPAALLRRALAVWAAARPAVVAGGLAVALVASHAFGLALQWAAATLSALGIAAWGHRRGSLSPSGAVAAAVVGLATLGCSLRLGATLLAFFFASSKLTHFKEEVKAALEEGAKRGGRRDWRQVLCNSGVPTLLAVGYGALAGCLDLPLGGLPGVEPWRADLLTLLLGGFLGYYACCCGDTWASELGPLSADTPRLVTTLKPVRRGTNGGVTLLGLSASAAGGLFTGLVFFLAAVVSPTLWVFDAQRAAALAQWRLVPLGLAAGLFGSLLDSLLGATLQFTGYDVAKGKIVSRPGPDVVHISGAALLSNNAVNLVSATLTSAATALVALRLFA